MVVAYISDIVGNCIYTLLQLTVIIVIFEVNLQSLLLQRFQLSHYQQFEY